MYAAMLIICTQFPKKEELFGMPAAEEYAETLPCLKCPCSAGYVWDARHELGYKGTAFKCTVPISWFYIRQSKELLGVVLDSKA
jgi:hypothetical protein